MTNFKASPQSEAPTLILSARPARIAVYTAIVFLIAFVALATDINRNGIAASYSDPLARIRTQDEAVYVDSAMRMVQDGDWLTPRVMGRLFFQKPPLLFWLSAVSIRLFGLGLFSVRFPALLLGAAGAAAVFWWCAYARSITAGVLASAVLVLSPFWQMFSRVCYTDILASSFGILTLACVAADPQLLARRTRVAVGVFGAAAILSKSIAGLLPLAVLILYYIVLPGGRRPRLPSILEALFVLFAVAAPWHIYQLLVHPQWFWADYVQLELLGIGLRAERNGVFNRPAWFYAQRLLQMDPVIALMPFLGLAQTWRVVRFREASSRLTTLLWVVVVVLALLAFQAKNLPYIVLLLPALCTFGALNGPRFMDRWPRATFAVIGILFVVRVVAAGQPWSLRPSSPPLESAKALRAYYDFHREAELIAVQPDDEFYSATLPLPHVRYVFLDPSNAVQQSVPYYVPLGITLTAQQFISLPALLPEFMARLHMWGLDSEEPVGSVVTVAKPSEVADIVRSRRDTDFYLPSSWNIGIKDIDSTYEVVQYSTTRLFLLSRGVRLRHRVPQLPAQW